MSQSALVIGTLGFDWSLVRGHFGFSISIPSSASAISSASSAAESAAASSATAAVSSAATTAAASAVSTTSSATTAAAALFARARFVDGEGAAAVLLAVERRDRRIRFRVAGHLDKSKTFASPGVAIVDDLCRHHGAMRSEKLLELGAVHAVGQIAHVQLLSHRDLLNG
jgi:hypothetical protein